MQLCTGRVPETPVSQLKTAGRCPLSSVERLLCVATEPCLYPFGWALKDHPSRFALLYRFFAAFLVFFFFAAGKTWTRSRLDAVPRHAAVWRTRAR